MMIFAAGCCW